VRVRTARGDDFDRVTALLELLGRPAVTRETHADAQAIYERQVHDPDAHHLVAEDETGRVIGFCSLHFRRRLNQVSEEAWVPDLYVLEASRRRGVARALLEEAQRRARDRDCHALAAEAAYRHAEAHHLYRGLRLRDTGKYFRKDLSK
jgi:ribosomal-protein-alanine N-acetyltransferase